MQAAENTRILVYTLSTARQRLRRPKAGQGSPWASPRPRPAAKDGSRRSPVPPYPAQLRQSPRRPLPILCQPTSLPVFINGVAGGGEDSFPLPYQKAALCRAPGGGGGPRGEKKRKRGRRPH